MFTVRNALEGLLSMCPNQKFAPGKGEFYAGQPLPTAAGNVANQRIGTLAVGVLNNSSVAIAINDLSISPATFIDAWLAEGTTIPAAATRGAMALTIRNPQGNRGLAQASSTTTVLNLPAAYVPVASALIGLSVFYITGANAGTSQVISANTTTTVTTAAFASTPATGDIYVIGGAMVDVRNLVATATLATDYVLQWVAYN